DDKLRIRPGSITYIGADSGTGKSSLMVNMAINIARKGHHVAIASIEMTNEELAVRAGGILGGVDTERLEDSLLSPTEMEHMQFVVEQNKEIMKRVHLIDPATLDVDAVPSLVNEAVIRFGVVAFFLAEVPKCQAKGPTIITKTDRVAYISEVLTATAKSTQVPIIALAQLSRDASVSAGSGKKKGMHNLRDTSQLENDAHLVA